MALEDRLDLFSRLEAKRGRPLVTYVTSARRGIEASIARDTVSELVAQLQALPADAKELDLLLVSNGGDGTVAWRIVSLIRERVEKFSVLVPQAAFSAATLIALGADEIVMHPYGNLGPTDPQLTNVKKQVQFGSQDLAAFLRFAREEVGLSDQAQLQEVFQQFIQEVGSVGIGVAARSSQLAVSMGEKLLLLHMKSDNERQQARVISESLNTKFFHHGYPVSRKEAKEIGLRVAPQNAEVEELMWKIWSDIEREMQIREPFSPIRVLKEDPNCAALFAPVPQANLPSDLPPDALKAWFQNFIQNHAGQAVPPAPYELLYAVMESSRHATRYVSTGSVFASRSPDLQIKLSVISESEGWVDLSVPAKKTPAKPAILKKQAK